MCESLKEGCPRPVSGEDILPLTLTQRAILELGTIWLDKEGGFLLGTCSEKGNVVSTLLHISPSKHSAGSFFATPEALLKTLGKQAATNLAILGIWHTHPLGGSWSLKDIDTHKEFAAVLDGAYSLLLCPDSHECLYMSSTGDITPGHVTLANIDYNENT